MKPRVLNVGLTRIPAHTCGRCRSARNDARLFTKNPVVKELYLGWLKVGEALGLSKETGECRFALCGSLQPYLPTLPTLPTLPQLPNIGQLGFELPPGVGRGLKIGTMVLLMLFLVFYIFGLSEEGGCEKGIDDNCI